MIRKPEWMVAAAIFAALTGLAPSYGAQAGVDVRRDATVEVIEQVMPSVVNLATETILEYRDPYEDMVRRFYGAPGATPRRERLSNLGSGVIIDEEGYVLTNFHVVRRASRIQVKLWDGREYDAIPLVFTAASDVALLKLRAKPGEKFKALRFAQDDDLLLGETVLALGNPYGLGSSVSKGILSSKNRRPLPADASLQVQDWLQTDASINPGNSGGPLVNLRGELIGLNVAVSRGPEEKGMGVGFSIPVKQVSLALSYFFAPEITHSLWFGAHVSAGGAPLKVTSVEPGSPAAKAGLRENDEILQVNGKLPVNLIAFNSTLGASPNRAAKLSVTRAGKAQILTVNMVALEDVIRQKTGLKLIQPTAETAGNLGINPGKGLFITEVEPGSPGAKANLQDGHFLLGVDEEPATDITAVARILIQKKAGDRVHLSIGVQRHYQNLVQVRTAEVVLAVR